MRQLSEWGWMHHLARHSVACFLTRGDLYVSWEEGKAVFEELLIDAVSTMVTLMPYRLLDDRFLLAWWGVCSMLAKLCPHKTITAPYQAWHRMH